MNGGDSKNPGYAATIASPPSLSKPPKGYGCPIIQARTTTHNGMPAVIFEVKDYYRFMAEEYKLTIVDRCYFQRRVEKFLLGSTYSRRLEQADVRHRHNPTVGISDCDKLVLEHWVA
ncbi:PREDICTED: uncharacterized protein LOC109214314 isoform X2 [Nicotiana attenuata]|uniref:uncharacterized protein LOC109214314 isoform X2 n=1 Tax=Nicotiana attenuata TaxID=49451 RepID=UPI0009046A06|nr:PREDICTED: uncharacterized protein LOC109214314 isoform X2 [Nicotiana attenuata]